MYAATVRTYERKNRGTSPLETYMEAAKEILAKSSSLRKACAKYSINFIALQRLCKMLEQRNVYDIFIEFCSNLAEVYDKHKF